MSERLRGIARDIFKRAMHAVDVQAAVRARLVLTSTALICAGRSISLSAVDDVLVIALGKAAVPMYMAAAEALDGLDLKGVVVAPPETLPTAPSLDDTRREPLYLPGDHPIPGSASLHAAERVLQALSLVASRTVVLFLISGGASAMVDRPLAADVTLEHLRAFTQALVGSGLGITAMNTLRKHLSAVKGGRLAVAAGRAALQCTLLVSDVPSSAADAIGSGPSLPDSTTVADCRALLQPIHAPGPLPASVLRWFRSPLLPETPKPSHPAFSRAHWEVVLSSEHLVEAARQAALAHGFYTEVDNSCDDWDYRVAARHLLDHTRSIARREQRPVCLISVGEVGVTLDGAPGEGGRNQQFALWCGQVLAESGYAMTVLSAGSDGVDGHSSAAGAVCDETTAGRATSLGMSSRKALLHFNTTPLLRVVNDVIRTGPTGNNLRDLRLLLVSPDEDTHSS